MKFFVIALLVGCGAGPSDRAPDSNKGNTGGEGNGQTTDGCSDEAKSVYVVDQNNTLSRFNPPTKSFMDLGKLMC
ncbi:MAG: hypothetical protein H0T65_16765, partial [Deltaproteobacteria bacterium]|nr:hypothetical protein [Deltaproteobacteria bacterium]